MEEYPIIDTPIIFEEEKKEHTDSSSSLIKKENSGMPMNFSLPSAIELHSIKEKNCVGIKLDFCTSEVVQKGIRTLFQISDSSQEVVLIYLSQNNEIQVNLLDSLTATQISIPINERLFIYIFFYENLIQVAYNENQIASKTTKVPSQKFLENTIFTFGGYTKAHHIDEYLFMGTIYRCHLLTAKEIKLLHPMKTQQLIYQMRPLSSLEDFHFFNGAQYSPANPNLVEFRPRGESQKKICKRKVLLCHDVPGRIEEDFSPYGDFSTSKSYRFRYWNNIDTFCYFGHSLVIIPPTGYIVAGHRMGVKVLGTLVTEGEDGKNFNEKILNDLIPIKDCPGKYEKSKDVFHYATKLIEIALSYGFDGYLINIEAPVAGELVSKLL